MIAYQLTHRCKRDGLGKEIKLLGYYSSAALAQVAIERFRPLEGFCDYPDGYRVRKRLLFRKRLADIDWWADGFFSYTYTK